MIVADLFAKLGLKVDKQSFSSGDKFIKNIKTGIAGVISGLAARKIFNFFQETVMGVTKVADELGDMSERLGIATDTLQQLGHAAELSGSNLEEVSLSVMRLSRFLFEAKQGGDSQRDTLKKMGIAWKDATGNLRAADEVLGDIAERFSKMPDGTQKTAEAMELFGRSGARLIPMLNAGRAGLAEMRMEFVQLGGQLTKEEIRAFKQFDDDMVRFRVLIDGLKKRIAVALLPSIQAVFTTIMKWVKTNRELLKQKIESAIDKMVKAATFLWKVLQEIYQIGRKVVDWASQFRGKYDQAAKAIAMGVSALVAFKIAALAVGGALAVISSPIAAMVAIVGVLGVGLAKAFDEDVITVFGDALLFVADTLNNIVKAIIWIGEHGGDMLAQALDFFGLIETKSEAQRKEEGRQNLVRNVMMEMPEATLGKGASRPAASTSSTKNITTGPTTINMNISSQMTPEKAKAVFADVLRKSNEALARDISAATGQ